MTGARDTKVYPAGALPPAGQLMGRGLLDAPHAFHPFPYPLHDHSAQNHPCPYWPECACPGGSPRPECPCGIDGDTRAPHGWWIIPMGIVGALIWGCVIWFAT